MISLNNVMGIIRRWKYSIVSLRLWFLGNPHKIIWVSWGVLSKGLRAQKGPQTPCWLRPWVPVLDTIPNIDMGIGKILVPFNPSNARLLSFKAQGRKDVLKPSKLCHCGMHWIALAENYQMSTHEPGFLVIFQVLLFAFCIIWCRPNWPPAT